MEKIPKKPVQPLTDDPQADPPQHHGAGWLVLRIRPGEGVVLGDSIEVRLASINNHKTGNAQVAIRAARHLPIRRVR